ncbi:hypothetical protein Tco_0164381 [Tanacetum coccineum]
MLSIGGRLTLIKYVLNSIPLYHMSIYKVLMGVLNNMEAIRINFLNGVDKADRKISWIGWKKVLVAKKNGGLGVSSYFAFNRALLFKWIWRFKSNGSSLWARVIKAIHGKNGSINGNGEDTLFWKDSWHADDPLKNLYLQIFSLESAKDITIADKFSYSSFSLTLRKNPRGGLEESQFDLLCSNLANVILPHSCDRWVWNININGEFSVKSTRDYIDEKMLPKEDTATRWLKCIPNMINIFA